jgi:PIN domain nuclease of toxin-antitoxin system
VRLLLDTNAFVLFAVGSPRLSPRVRSLIEDQEDDLLVSAVTPWELTIKSALGKLSLPADVSLVYRTTRDEVRASELPVTAAHALHVRQLPLIHGDPFDRMLVAQAQIEELAIVTNDRTIRSYGVDVIW